MLAQAGPSELTQSNQSYIHLLYPRLPCNLEDPVYLFSQLQVMRVMPDHRHKQIQHKTWMENAENHSPSCPPCSLHPACAFLHSLLAYCRYPADAATLLVDVTGGICE